MTEKKDPDGVKQYIEALLYFILLDMTHRDGIREGDGWALITRVHMLQLWRHNKHLIANHRLLAGRF